MKQKKITILVYVVLFLVSIILIWFGYLYGEQIGGVAISVGASIIATIIINVLTTKFIGDPLSLIAESMRMTGKKLNETVDVLAMTGKEGILGVWQKRADLDTGVWVKHLEEAEGDIDILCYAMAFLPEHPKFKQTIEEKISHGSRVRVLFGNPNGECVANRTKEEKTEGSIAERIVTSEARVRAISDSIEIRYFDAPLYASIYNFGSEMFVTPQLYGVRGACAPLFLLEQKEDGLYESYAEYFESVWGTATEKIECMK